MVFPLKNSQNSLQKNIEPYLGLPILNPIVPLKTQYKFQILQYYQMFKGRRQKKVVLLGGLPHPPRQLWSKYHFFVFFFCLESPDTEK